MTRPNKLVVGIRPTNRMFRMTSRFGELADEIVASFSRIELPANYFSEVSLGNNQLMLKDEAGSRIFRVTLDDLTFSHDYVATGKYPIEDKFLKEFFSIYKVSNEIIKMKAVRRIGIYGEYRFENKKPSDALCKFLTPNLGHGDGFPAKFQLNIQSRFPTKGKALPKEDVDDFTNVIQQFYDGQLDVDHPNPDAAFATLDVQRYFAPNLEGSIEGPIKTLAETYHRFEKALQPLAQALGVNHEATIQKERP